MVEPNHSDEAANVPRRSILRATTVGAAGIPLVGAAAADGDEDEPDPDDPLPVEDPPTALYVCDPDDEEHYTEVTVAEPTHEFGEELTIDLESEQDGSKVQVGVLLPDLEDGETAPVILRATPYVDDLREKSLRDCIRTRRLAENFVEHGYAVAAVPVRGTGGSGGCMELFGANEQADVDQAVSFLGGEPMRTVDGEEVQLTESNGNVAIIGRSYDGTTPWMAARHGNPHLKTVVPFSGVPDIHDLMYRRGSAEPRGYAILPGLYYIISLADHSPLTGTGLATYLERASCPDNYADGAIWSSYSGVTGDRDPGGYWTERVLKNGLETSYDGSVMMVHGLQDWNVNPSQVYPWIDELQEAGIETRVYFGQFGHHYPDDERIMDDPSYNGSWADFVYLWFESELKGRGRDELRALADGAAEDDGETNIVDPFEARVHAQRDDGEWYAAENWPPAEAAETTLYLGTDGDLRATPDPETGEEIVYVDETRQYDPTRPSDPEPGCDSCVTFLTNEFADDFRIAGAPEVDVTVTPTGPGGHITAFLYAVDGEDEAERLGWGQVDLRHAQDRPSSEEVVPGEEIEVNLPLEPLDVVVPAGDRLALVLHQGTTGDRTHSPTPMPIAVETGDENALTVDAWNAPVPGSFDIAGEREDSGSVFTGGQTNRTDLDVEVLEPEGREVIVRDTVPADWEVDEAHGDVEATRETDDGATHVYFGLDEPRSEYEELTHFAEAPDDPLDSGEYTFGPIAVSTETDDDGTLTDREWVTISGTDRTVSVVAEET